MLVFQKARLLRSLTCLRSESSLAVGQVIVPDTNKRIVEPQLSHFHPPVKVESPPPLPQRFRVVDTDVINVLHREYDSFSLARFHKASGSLTSKLNRLFW